MTSEPTTNGTLTPITTPAVSGTLGGVRDCKVLFSSIPIEGEEGKDNLALILTDERVIIWREAPLEMTAVHAVTYEATDVDEETGEIVTKQRLILIDPDGKMYVSSSSVCFNYILRLTAVYGPFPWLNGRRLVFKKAKTGTGKECLTCTIRPTSAVPTTSSPPKREKSGK